MIGREIKGKIEVVSPVGATLTVTLDVGFPLPSWITFDDSSNELKINADDAAAIGYFKVKIVGEAGGE